MSRLAQYLAGLQRFGIRPGLERIAALLERAGNPQDSYPILLVGGTNGKGSTCEFAARLLARDGRKIGLYTSPHLYQWNERLRILPGDGLFEGAISDADFDALFDDARPIIQSVRRELGQPTEFEVVTFLGLWHFARQNVDAAVVEVGLGGKWDATNVTNPLVSVITHVALDHCDRLGETLEEIAADKIQIARPGRFLLTAETKPKVLQVFADYCREIGAILRPVPASDADFQFVNFASAQAACAELSQNLAWQFAAPTEAETTAILACGVPGRAEIIAREPNILLDGANNPDGAAILARHLTEELQIPPEKLILVLGILADKDWAAMIEILAPLGKTVIATQSNSPRAALSHQIAQKAREFCKSVEEIAPVSAALERARALAKSDDWVVVTGSFYTVAEVPRDS